MILRKPYAFLIKNFKLIHAVITFLMAYVLYKTLDILSAFDEFFLADAVLMSSDAAANTYPGTLFLLIFLILLLSAVLFWVMLIKQKPFKIYIVNFVIYVLTLVMFILGKNMFTEMTTKVLDIRFVKMIRDLTTMVFLAQMYPLIKSFVRAVGFDIKQFDFGKDLAELEIEEKDNEEFEVNVDVNTNKMKRGYNLQIRNLKYFYKEHKLIINSIAGFFAFVLITITTIGIIRTTSKMRMNSYFTVDNFSFKILNAYATNTSYNSTELTSDKTLIVIPFEVKNKNNVLDRSIVTANIELSIGNHKFRNNEKYKYSVYDLGSVYAGETIEHGETAYKAFLFEIPNSYLNKKMKLKFISSIDVKRGNLIPTYVSIPLTITNLNKNNEQFTVNASEELDLSKTILKNSTLNLESFDIAKRFKINYNLKINDEVIPSYEYIKAPIESTQDKSLLKITGTVTFDENSNIKSLNELINVYGTIKYKIGDKEKEVTNLTKVDPSSVKLSKTLYYIIPSEVENAESVSLVLKIRNKEYEYKIK